MSFIECLVEMSASSCHAIVISSNEEEESIVISLDESDDLPSVKYARMSANLSQ